MMIDMISGSGCWLSDLTISCMVANQFGGHQTFWNESFGFSGNTSMLVASLQHKHISAGPPDTVGFADANFGGAVFDHQTYSGGVLLIGTAVVTICRKQCTTAFFNATAEAEFDAASTI